MLLHIHTLCPFTTFLSLSFSLLLSLMRAALLPLLLLLSSDGTGASPLERHTGVRTRSPTDPSTHTRHAPTTCASRLSALRGGQSASGSPALTTWLRVVMRMFFPGNPPRERAPPPPPPPPAPPAAKGGKAAGGKSRGGAAVAVGSKAEFDKALASARPNQLVVVDFHATWCGPCKQIAPAYEKMAAEFSQAKFLKVDVDQCKDISQAYGVKSMPTFKLLKGGKEVATLSGADEGSLREKVSAHAGKKDRWSNAGPSKRL